MSALSAERRRQRASKARLTQSYPSDHPKIIEADRNLAALRLEDYVAKVVASAPPLTPEQRDRIAAILRGGGSAA